MIVRGSQPCASSSVVAVCRRLRIFIIGSFATLNDRDWDQCVLGRPFQQLGDEVVTRTLLPATGSPRMSTVRGSHRTPSRYFAMARLRLTRGPCLRRKLTRHCLRHQTQAEWNAPVE